MANVSRVIVGKKAAIERLMVALMANGHILLEDVPGLGKTLMAKTLAISIGGDFKRIQFTPDLLPADITGFNVFNQLTGQFDFKPGPIMANILLADEINRAIPRTQSSLLEGMEERQMTIDGKTICLPRPFLVIATQNPIELEGTFPLPEAQLDRFMIKIELGYPDHEEEKEILSRFQQEDPLSLVDAVAEPEHLIELQARAKRIHVSDPIRDYIATMVIATRNSPYFRFGASPRGSLALMRAGQAMAMLRDREYVLPDDIKELAAAVLAHRLILTEDERLRGNSPGQHLASIIRDLPVPVVP